MQPLPRSRKGLQNLMANLNSLSPESTLPSSSRDRILLLLLLPKVPERLQGRWSHRTLTNTVIVCVCGSFSSAWTRGSVLKSRNKWIHCYNWGVLAAELLLSRVYTGWGTSPTRINLWPPCSIPEKMAASWALVFTCLQK